MLKAFRPTTGAYLQVEIDGQVLHLYAKGDAGQQANVTKIYESAEAANAELENVYGLALHHGLIVAEYRRQI